MIPVYPPWLGWALSTGGIWTPASLPSLAAWYEAVDEDATLVKATAPPAIVNGDFAAGTTGWTLDAGWSVGSGVASHAAGVGDYITPDAINLNTISGNRYAWDWDVAAFTSGAGFRWYVGTSLGFQTVPGTYSEEATVSSVAFQLYGASTTIGSVDNFRNLRNLTRTRWNPTAGSLGGYLSQATATAQPWWDSTAFGGLGALKFTAEDSVASSLSAASWKALHKSATIFIPFYSSASDAVQYLFDTLVVASTNHGIAFWFDGSAERVYCRIGNGSGTYVLNSASAGSSVAKSTPHLAELSIGATYEVMVDGVSLLSGSLVGLSTSDPASTLRLGGPASNSIVGNLGEPVIALGQITAAERLSTRTYLAAKHGITLP